MYALLLLAVALASAGTAAGPELRIAAASDLQPVLPRIVRQFEAETGARVSVAFGSSGSLFAQIENGAPFDLFFCADTDYPERLRAEGLVAAGGLRHYATGRLVLWARRDAGVDVSQGLAALTAPSVRRIAVANPAHAPYGRAAMAALAHVGLERRLRDRLVFGENVSQAAQFAQSGNAEAALIPLSLARTPALEQAGVYTEVPDAFHPPLTQAAVVLRTSAQADLARRFLALFDRPAIRQLMQDFGLVPPPLR